MNRRGFFGATFGGLAAGAVSVEAKPTMPLVVGEPSQISGARTVLPYDNLLDAMTATYYVNVERGRIPTQIWAPRSVLVGYEHVAGQLTAERTTFKGLPVRLESGVVPVHEMWFLYGWNVVGKVTSIS